MPATTTTTIRLDDDAVREAVLAYMRDVLGCEDVQNLKVFGRTDPGDGMGHIGRSWVGASAIVAQATLGTPAAADRPEGVRAWGPYSRLSDRQVVLGSGFGGVGLLTEDQDGFAHDLPRIERAIGLHPEGDPPTVPWGRDVPPQAPTPPIFGSKVRLTRAVTDLGGTFREAGTKAWVDLQLAESPEGWVRLHFGHAYDRGLVPLDAVEPVVP